MTEAPDAAGGIVNADFDGIAARFAVAGFKVTRPARGILQIVSQAPAADRLALLLSVGVHGDETAPIEILASLLDELAATPQALAVDLLAIVGNPDAIAAGRRFVDADMNRMFRKDRGELDATRDARRADDIIAAVHEFFTLGHDRKWHLDLHTAIRPSLYPTFAVVPDVIADANKKSLIAWLGAAGIEAAVLNRKLAGTFSAYTALEFGATSCTAELGQVGKLGTNDLSQFAQTRTALAALLRSGRTDVAGSGARVFYVAQEIIKHSEQFTMAFGRSTKNFEILAPGSLIAEDGDIVYRVGAEPEHVIFPNPDVRIGQRAGLMIKPRDGGI